MNFTKKSTRIKQQPGRNILIFGGPSAHHHDYISTTGRSDGLAGVFPWLAGWHGIMGGMALKKIPDSGLTFIELTII